MIKLVYYLYRRYKGIPCRSEISDILRSNKRLSPAILEAAQMYKMGFDVGMIARINKITRERVRQYLLKATR
jgi:hypothetical protein